MQGARTPTAHCGEPPSRGAGGAGMGEAGERERARLTPVALVRLVEQYDLERVLVRAAPQDGSDRSHGRWTAPDAAGEKDNHGRSRVPHRLFRARVRRVAVFGLA